MSDLRYANPLIRITKCMRNHIRNTIFINTKQFCRKHVLYTS